MDLYLLKLEAKARIDGSNNEEQIIELLVI